ncbi:MAG: 50S ribosomal protein L23 [Candidatus Berkelbacteria bacterium]
MKQIILQPILSEKSLAGIELGKFIFVVDDSANKHQVAQALKEIYNVDATKVNMIKVQPENKLVRGRFKAHAKGFKKAIVTLKKGQKIEGFEFKD